MRSHVLQVRGYPPNPSMVQVNGMDIPPGDGTPGWSVVPEEQHSLAAPAGCIVVRAGRFPVRQAVNIVVGYDASLNLHDAAAADGSATYAALS